MTVSCVLALGLVAAAACDSEKEAACRIDTDCTPGLICREERCGPVGADASTSQQQDSTAPACVVEGASCTNADECCSRACTSGRCGSTTPPPAPTCRGLYELCQNDCCPGYNCTNGSCR